MDCRKWPDFVHSLNSMSFDHCWRWILGQTEHWFGPVGLFCALIYGTYAHIFIHNSTTAFSKMKKLSTEVIYLLLLLYFYT